MLTGSGCINHVAILPVLPIGYGVGAYARFLSRIYELQQRIHLSGLAFAVGVTGLLTPALGLLEAAGLPPVSMIAVFPLLTTSWGIGPPLTSSPTSHGAVSPRRSTNGIRYRRSSGARTPR